MLESGRALGATGWDCHGVGNMAEWLNGSEAEAGREPVEKTVRSRVAL
jgi:hypothetical protein